MHSSVPGAEGAETGLQWGGEGGAAWWGWGRDFGKKPGKLHNPQVHKASEFQNQPGRRVKLEWHLFKAEHGENRAGTPISV